MVRLKALSQIWILNVAIENLRQWNGGGKLVYSQLQYVCIFVVVVYIILIHSFIKNRRHCHRHRDYASLVVFPNFMYKYFEDFLPFRNSSNYLVLLKRYFIVSSIVCIYNLFIQFFKIYRSLLWIPFICRFSSTMLYRSDSRGAAGILCIYEWEFFAILTRKWYGFHQYLYSQNYSLCLLDKVI